MQETRGKSERSETSPSIRSYRDLKVYQAAYKSTMELFWISKKFPVDEKYTLVDQLRRSSRSVSANIVEGWAKRHHPNIFKKHLLDSIGSCDETRHWLNIARDCQYLSPDDFLQFDKQYEEIGKMLGSLFKRWHKIEKE